MYQQKRGKNNTAGTELLSRLGDKNKKNNTNNRIVRGRYSFLVSEDLEHRQYVAITQAATR